MCLVPLTVLLLEFTWVQENLNSPANTLSDRATNKEFTNLPSEEFANQISTGLSNMPTTADFNVGTPTSSSWRKTFKLKKISETRKSINEEKRQKNNVAKPTIN